MVSIVDFLNDSNDLGGHLAHLHERWNNRLSFEKSNLVKEYLNGRLSIICYGHRVGGPEGKKNAPLSDFSVAELKNSTGCVGCCNVRYGGYRITKDGKSVFVDIPEFSDNPKEILTALIRSYSVDNGIGDIGKGSLYYSLTDRVYKVLPRLVHRKLTSLSPSFSGGFSVKVASNMFKRRSKVMNYVPENNSKFHWKGVSPLNLDAKNPPAFVEFNGYGVALSAEEALKTGIKLRDVLIGSFDL